MDNDNSTRISNWTLATGTEPEYRDVRICHPAKSARSVLVISTEPQPPQVLETIMKAGEYDVVFIESTTRAYSRIKRAIPDAVVVCLGPYDNDAFQFLSMMALDRATSSIPVVMYTPAGSFTQPLKKAPKGRAVD